MHVSRLYPKQAYHYDMDSWLEKRGSDPFKSTRKAAPRHDHWHHMYNADIVSMPDKSEYPWKATGPGMASWSLPGKLLNRTS